MDLQCNLRCSVQLNAQDQPSNNQLLPYHSPKASYNRAFAICNSFVIVGQTMDRRMLTTVLYRIVRVSRHISHSPSLSTEETCARVLNEGFDSSKPTLLRVNVLLFTINAFCMISCC